MQELINKLMSEVGLSSDQATKALNTVVGHVKGILPPAFAANIDNLMAGKVSPDADALEPKHDGIMDKASDMAGAAKDKLGDLAEGAKDKFDDLAASAKEKLGIENLDELKDKAGDLAEGAMNKLKGLFGGNKEA